MAYLTVLWIHSWLRWVILGLAIAVIVSTARGTRTTAAEAGAASFPVAELGREGRLFGAFVGALDLQFLLGLLLYFVLSPLTPSSFEGLRAALRVTELRFFAVEHVTAMLFAVIAAHVARSLARRARSLQGARRRFLIGTCVTLVLILLGIPWPGMPYGRPLLRLAL